MNPKIRYQAAVIQDDHVLLLKVWDHTFTGHVFWVVPGGGRQAKETEEACVRREVWEETHLEVEVERLILDEPDAPNGMYESNKTYACRIVGGVAQPGTEPEVDTPDLKTIIEIGWFDLRDPESRDSLAKDDPITNSNLQRIRAALGYI